MAQKIKISIRLEKELLSVLKENSSNNLSAYIETLIVKGLMCDFIQLNENAKNNRSAQQDISDRDSETELKDIKFDLLIIQELCIKIAMKQGYTPDDIRAMFKRIQDVANKEGDN